MHLARFIAVLGAAVAVSAQPADELFKRQAASCSAFSKTCYNTALRHQVRAYCTETLYPYTTITTTQTSTTVSLTTTTVSPSPSTKYVPAKTTATSTSTTTIVSTAVETASTTISSTSYVPQASQCTGSPTPGAARRHRRANSAKCIATYTASSQYSSACSCLGITKISTFHTSTTTTTTVQSTKTVSSKVSTTTITTTSTKTVVSSTSTVTTSTSTPTNIATATGFALWYNGNYAKTQKTGWVNLGGPDSDPYGPVGQPQIGSVITFALSSSGQLNAIAGDYAGNFGYIYEYPNGDLVRFDDVHASSGSAVVYCSITDSCLLSCRANGESGNYIYSSNGGSGSEADGAWFIADPNTAGHGVSFAGPSVVAAPGSSS